MSIAAAVATALEQYEFDEETGFNRQADSELPCLHCVLSAHRDGRLLLLLSKRSNLPPTEFTLASRSTAIRLSRKTFADTVPAYARESPEADACVAALERLPTAFETPVDVENDRKKAKFTPTELPDGSPVRRGVAQATPQKRQRALREDDDELEESSIRDSEAPESMALSPAMRKSRLLAELRHQTQPVAVNPPVQDRYTTDFGGFRTQALSKQTERFLRAYNIDTNSLHWCEVYSQTRGDEPVAIVKATGRGGVVGISELERNNDQSIADTESRMSEVACLCSSHPWAVAVSIFPEGHSGRYDCQSGNETCGLGGHPPTAEGTAHTSAL
ncbi:hypothetical protein FDENT_2287 [Fusarium denticulatum]|uniref:Uncharacterized protein n=1 Tax=Fusarium denticulatum TaxID=48507 RepID=A0A8H5XGF8_9HYPO|nr:hypothetical protein FDENT_2287 [Fusarium denticulatum]